MIPCTLGMQFGHALNGASGMSVNNMSQPLNPVDEVDRRLENKKMPIITMLFKK